VIDSSVLLDFTHFQDKYKHRLTHLFCH